MHFKQILPHAHSIQPNIFRGYHKMSLWSFLTNSYLLTYRIWNYMPLFDVDVGIAADSIAIFQVKFPYSRDSWHYLHIIFQGRRRMYSMYKGVKYFNVNSPCETVRDSVWVNNFFAVHVFASYLLQIPMKLWYANESLLVISIAKSREIRYRVW